MTASNKPQVSQRLVSEGVSIIGTGVMGAAYAARLASLGVPVTVFNRTAAKAEAVAKAHRNVKVVATVADAARAAPNILVACSPTMAAISAICEQLARVVRDRHVTFIVDAGLPPAQVMADVLFERGHAASVTNVAMFGTAYGILDGSGTLMNASGKAASADVVTEHVLPLLELFGAASYHQGGTAVAAHFAMAGHMAFMPAFYGLMHYVGMMTHSGVSPQAALGYFQTTYRAIAEGFAPLLAPAFEKHDYSLFFGTHQLAKDIMDSAAQTCETLGVDAGLARLMAGYHERAMADPRLAATSFHAAHEVIARPRG